MVLYKILKVMDFMIIALDLDTNNEELLHNEQLLQQRQKHARLHEHMVFFHRI